MNAVDIIAKKRDGGEHSTEEIRFIILAITSEIVPDYQAAAWLMAVFLRGMSRRETLDLTMAMRDSGDRIDLLGLTNRPSLDKHSTGGVGDKTSLVVVPILAAAGVSILKMSGRGLGYSGGTVDKLESIPGFRTNLSVDESRAIVKRVGAVMIAQNSQLAPADKILYSLRDVTATIESIPLIASSIMSKKLAAGGERILLDVKCGRGAFMKTRDRAKLLAQELVGIGIGAGVPTIAVLTAMDEPLGYAIGNGLEVREAIEILFSGNPRSLHSPFLDLCLQLAAYGLVSACKTESIEHGRNYAAYLLKNGAALSKFVEIVAAQGGPNDAMEILTSLPKADATSDVTAETVGCVASVDAEAIGKLATEIGAGRLNKDDKIDHSAGIVLHCKTGSHVSTATPLATLHLRQKDIHRTGELSVKLRAAYQITDIAPRVPESLILGVVR